MLTKILEDIEALVGRDAPEPPKPEDFKNTGDYIFARGIHKRFPKVLNPPSENIACRNEALVELWAWANGEKGIGKIKPGYSFLSHELSEEIYRKIFVNTPVHWLQKLTPFLDAPNGYYICIDERGSIFSVNLTDGHIYLVAESIEKYFSFLLECIRLGLYGDRYSDELDPAVYTKIEIKAAKLANLENCYPFKVNEETVLDNLLLE